MQVLNKVWSKKPLMWVKLEENQFVCTEGREENINNKIDPNISVNARYNLSVQKSKII